MIRIIAQHFVVQIRIAVLFILQLFKVFKIKHFLIALKVPAYHENAKKIVVSMEDVVKNKNANNSKTQVLLMKINLKRDD